MFREILPILAYMSVLSSTYSLHMARDAYIKAPPPPPPAAQLLEELDDMSALLAENSIPAGPPQLHSKSYHLSAMQQQQQQQQLHTIGGVSAGVPHGVVINHLTSNELPELSPPPVHHPVGPLVQPRGLQELFGVQTNYNIRSVHQQSSLQQQTSDAEGDNNDLASDKDFQRNPNNKRSSHSNINNGRPSGSSMDGGIGDGGGPMMNDGSSSSGSSISSSSGSSGGGSNGGLPPIPHGMASQLMLRSARGQRQYDVPQIECPPAMDGMERFACPTPDRQGRYRCIDDHVLCDGFIDCPEGEDEDRQACMFYKTTKAHLDVLADALLRWARGR
ncbi:uncharacterized protein LOC131435630 [Malaya genurostris]|uniref:uncharacterized protein LOC131435630 n=1 Tax=Malaya genurostris TaxID=325434 RepID=UPI0026F3C126|nr:uncharacterized protein LOC131435630 [Malaya genurostris]